MKYAILCYSQQGVVDALTPAQEDAMMTTIQGTSEALRREGKTGLGVRLLGTETAVTLRHGGAAPVVLDGPFAETKEQLLGLYVLECASLEDAIDAARRLANGRTPGSLEIRPLRAAYDYGAKV